MQQSHNHTPFQTWHQSQFCCFRTRVCPCSSAVHMWQSWRRPRLVHNHTLLMDSGCTQTSNCTEPSCSCIQCSWSSLHPKYNAPLKKTGDEKSSPVSCAARHDEVRKTKVKQFTFQVMDINYHFMIWSKWAVSRVVASCSVSNKWSLLVLGLYIFAIFACIVVPGIHAADWSTHPMNGILC